MSSKKVAEPQIGDGRLHTAPTPKPARKPRTPKVSGPQIYAVGKEGEDTSALVKAVTDNQAKEKVHGRYWARPVDSEEAVTLALKHGIKGIIDATVPATITE